VQGSHLLISTVNGFTLDETGVDAAADGAGRADNAERGDGAGAADLASAYIGALPAQRFPNLVALAAEFAYADPDERFELLIDIFVDGLARLAGQS
jgi:TetR/AcrR family tetracycline transcriptional repressor